MHSTSISLQHIVASYGWIKKGQEKPIATNSGKMRVNINGVINIDRYQMSTDFAKSIDSASTIRLLEKVDKMYSSAGKIHIVLDNASYYHSGLVRDWLSRHKRIKLHYLPKASPNLNLIERVWKFFNEKVRRNRYYETFELFLEVCKGFFRKWTKWTKELRTRLAENFQRLNLPQMHNE